MIKHQVLLWCHPDGEQNLHASYFKNKVAVVSTDTTKKKKTATKTITNFKSCIFLRIRKKTSK